MNERTHLSDLDPRTSLSRSMNETIDTTTPAGTFSNSSGRLGIRRNRFGLREFRSMDEFEAFARNAFQRLALRFAHPDRVRRHRIENLTGKIFFNLKNIFYDNFIWYIFLISIIPMTM